MPFKLRCSSCRCRYREIILLCDVEEMSYREIAEALTIPMGTVMSRLARARKAMRQLLAEKVQGASPMTCESWQQKIDAYLDAELPEAETRELDAHLRTCASCSSQALARSELKRSIHLAGKQFAPDPEFRKRIQNSISPKASGRRWGWIVEAGIACAAVLLVDLRFDGLGRGSHSASNWSES